MRIHWVFCTALAALILAPAQAATRIADPAVFVKGVYAHWATDKQPPDDIYTKRLQALFALDSKEAGGEVGRANDFSIWCNCQDGDLKKVAVKSWNVVNAPTRKVVEATFLLDDKPQRILFYFERGQTGWKIDDVQSTGTDSWTLSVLCKYGWPDNR